MHIKNKRGQSTVEYVLLVTAVVFVVLTFVTTTGQNGFRAQLCSTLNQVSQKMGDESGVLADSHAQYAPTGTGIVASVSTPPYTVNVELGL